MRVFMILDDSSDPAMEVVQGVLARHADAPVQVEILQHPLETCSLKCSSDVQVVSQLPPEYEIVAFLDGDVVPHAHWVQDLVTPFADPDVHFVTGYRWYEINGSLGTMVRYVWNLAACIHVCLNGVLWGGTSAVRRSTLDRLRLVDRWRLSLSDDILLTEVARQNHYKIHFVPTNLMMCREDCTFAFAHRWCSRQMLMTRLHCPVIWRRMLVMGWFLQILNLLSLSLAGYGLAMGDMSLFGISLGGLLLFWGGTYPFILVTESYAKKNVERYQSPIPKPTWWSCLCLTVVVPFTLSCFCSGLLCAACARRISWRGIDYRISRKGEIHRENYAPYLPKETSPTPKSLW